MGETKVNGADVLNPMFASWKRPKLQALSLNAAGAWTQFYT